MTDQLSPDIETRLGQLIDRQEITELISKLGRWLDERRFEEPELLLSDDVTAETPGGFAEGIAAVTAQAKRSHEPYDCVQHVITNVLVDLCGDRATAGANLIVTFVPDAASPSQYRVVRERYEFDAVRTNDGWRLSRVKTASVARS
jgi:hypothetical protein